MQNCLHLDGIRKRNAMFYLVFDGAIGISDFCLIEHCGVEQKVSSQGSLP